MLQGNMIRIALNLGLLGAVMEKALPYNFKNNAFLSNDQLEFISRVHESFANYAASSLSTLLHEEVNVKLLETNQIPLSLFLKSHSSQSYYAYLSSSLPKSSVLTISPELAHAAVSRLLGGEFKYPTAIRAFTTLEVAILRQFIRSFIQSLSQVWQPYLDFTPSISEIGSGLAKSETLQKITKFVVMTFKIKFANDFGFIDLLYPTDSLCSLGNALVSNEDRVPKNVGLDPHDLEISLKVSLGSLSLSPHELMSLKKGDVLKLDQLLTHPLPILVENTPIFSGYPGLTYKNKGVTLYARS